MLPTAESFFKPDREDLMKIRAAFRELLVAVRLPLMQHVRK
jgi:hypothetical protein